MLQSTPSGFKMVAPPPLGTPPRPNSNLSLQMQLTKMSIKTLHLTNKTMTLVLFYSWDLLHQLVHLNMSLWEEKLIEVNHKIDQLNLKMSKFKQLILLLFNNQVSIHLRPVLLKIIQIYLKV